MSPTGAKKKMNRQPPEQSPALESEYDAAMEQSLEMLWGTVTGDDTDAVTNFATSAEDALEAIRNGDEAEHPRSIMNLKQFRQMLLDTNIINLSTTPRNTFATPTFLAHL